MTADVAMVALLLRSDPVAAVANSLMKGFVWGACSIALIAWIMPAQSDLRLGDEELLGPNQIGYLCAFAFFLTIVGTIEIFPKSRRNYELTRFICRTRCF